MSRPVDGWPVEVVERAAKWLHDWDDIPGSCFWDRETEVSKAVYRAEALKFLGPYPAVLAAAQEAAMLAEREAFEAGYEAGSEDQSSYQHGGRQNGLQQALKAHLEAAAIRSGCALPPPSAPVAQVGGWQPTHRHKKRGAAYEVLGEATVQATGHLHDEGTVVVYRGEDGRLWVRPPNEFNDGRFEVLSDPPAPTPGAPA